MGKQSSKSHKKGRSSTGKNHRKQKGKQNKQWIQKQLQKYPNNPVINHQPVKLININSQALTVSKHTFVRKISTQKVNNVKQAIKQLQQLLQTYEDLAMDPEKDFNKLIQYMEEKQIKKKNQE